jgi:HAD superfamily hydrolase (TIGR01549 family)
MPIFKTADLIVFDCDGVLLDSNSMKIDAMQSALRLSNKFSSSQMSACVDYFKYNFGKSRYHHVAHFVSLLQLPNEAAEELEKAVIDSFSEQVEELYLKAPLAVGVLELLSSLRDKKLFVASGSEQEQLRRVLKKRGISIHFDDILGSPTSKAKNIATILENNEHSQAVMVGDALADYEAATMNNIKFVFYSPLSNVKDEMLQAAEIENFHVINDYSEVSK